MGDRNDGRDDEGPSKGGPIASWPPSSSSSSGPPAPGDSSARASHEIERGFWEDSSIPSMLLNFGLQSSSILEKSFKSMHDELSKIAEREKDRTHRLQEERERLAKEKFSERSRDLPSSYEREKQAQMQFLADFFGEDMFGASRTHPLFTSLFDEFLPEGAFQAKPSSDRSIGGQSVAINDRQTGQEVDRFFEPVLGRADDFFGRAFLKTFADTWLLGQRAFERLHREEMQRLHGQNVSEGHDQVPLPHRAAEEIGDDNYSRHHNRWIQSHCPPHYHKTEHQQPDTELDLYEHFADKSNADDQSKTLISTSTVVTTSTNPDGITTSKTIKEYHFADGTVQRVENTNERASATNTSAVRGPAGWDDFIRAFNTPTSHRRDFHDAFERERIRGGSETPEPNYSSKPATEARVVEIEDAKEKSMPGNGGGLSRFLWASKND